MIAYRPDIDGLRAVAIVTVVAGHVGLPGASGGFVGVDVFFVISGYLITALLLAEGAERGRIDLPAFYARRVRRLLPAFVTVLVSTLLLGALLLPAFNGELERLARSASASLLLNANHFFWLKTGGYFDPRSELFPLLHLWSLAVEEQFYLIWPSLLALLLGLGRPGDGRIRVFATLALVFPLSLGLSLWLTSAAASAAFYLMPTRAWELAAGALLALVRPGPGKERTALGNALAFVGAAAILGSVASFDDTTPFPGLAALAPAAGTVALIAAGALAPNGPMTRLLSARVMVALGLLSYSWYLWHWPLLALARSFRMEAPGAVLDALLGGAVALALAGATYRWIETPLRRREGPLGGRPRRALVAGALASLAGVALAAAVGAWATLGPRSQREEAAFAALYDRPPLLKRCHNDIGQPPRLADRALCTIPARNSGIDVVLWGDSMGDSWMPALSSVAESSGRSIYQLTRGSCPPLIGYNITHRDPTQAGKCREFQQLVIGELDRLQRDGLSTVVLSAAWTQRSDEAMGPALRATLDRLESLGLKVVILGPTPRLPFNVPLCLFRRAESDCSLPRSDFERQRADADRILREEVAGRDRVRLVDPVPFFCDERVCAATRDGTVLYTDSVHLSATASRAVAQRFGERLLDAGTAP